MSHRVTAVYDSLEKARLAAGDLESAGVDPTQIFLTDARIAVHARDADHALNVKGFLEEDGAQWAEIQEGTDDVLIIPAIPPGPAPSGETVPVSHLTS